MTKAEMKKVLVVEKVLDGHMTNVEGAAVLGITPRQIIRLKKTYLEKGTEGLSHQNRGREGNLYTRWRQTSKSKS